MKISLFRKRRLRAACVSGSAALSLTLAFAGANTALADLALPDGANFTVQQSAQTSKNGVYIVRLVENPVAAYEGDIKGLKATRPKPGHKLNPRKQAVIAYSDFLTSRHDSVLQQAGGGKKLYSYRYAYNGFAAQLGAEQINALRKMAGVVSVTPDSLLQPDTISTPDMLGLEAGIWNDLGGTGNAGEDVIVGIIDSGIWPESASFSDRTGSNPNDKPGKLNYQQIPGFHGKCTPGEAFPASKCNQKLIAAQWFNSGFGGDEAIKAAFPYEFASARDTDGHGTHTASTAAGNANVPVVINGSAVGHASGMAPRARVAAYKVCWGRGSDGGCFGSDSIAAIDQAVIDGVDVLNYSISGSLTSSLDQVEVAFLFAADAGVFVATSAGNSGPGASTVAHNSPWLTTVAAGTHDRGWEASIATADGGSYAGVSLGAGVGPADMVYSADVVDPGSDANEGRLCYPGTLDPGLVAGKIVLCDRGAIARTDKSVAVAQAGGVGMVLANTSPSSLNADFHSVPSIHVAVAEGDILRAYAQASGASGTISEGTAVTAEASQVAAFSSRGPALAGSGDLLKPDIMAPGVDVIAAVSPADGGENFGALSGTSMSSPHMAGLGALMKQAHPDWSPAAIKSAFMTTATQETNAGNLIAGTPFGYGAGFVQPNSAIDPGLVYDAGFLDWFGFLCGTGELQSASCAALGIDPSDLNYPSIAIGALPGAQTITRTVTNVGNNGNYTASVDGLAGIDVVIEPSSLNLAPGESASYTVTFTNQTAPIGAYSFGGITWSDGAHSVRSAVVLNPLALAVPAEIDDTGDSGSQSFDISFGYTGAYSVDVHGLQAAGTQLGNVADDPSNDFDTALATCTVEPGRLPFDCVGITWHLVGTTPGAALQRISLFNEYTDGDDDLDLNVFHVDGTQVGGSGSGSSAEQVDIVNPAPPLGLYAVAVHGWQTDGADSNYTLFSWSPSGDSGNMTVTAPGSATAGTTETVTVDWVGLTAEKYLGVLSHQDGAGEIGQTVINIQNDD